MSSSGVGAMVLCCLLVTVVAAIIIVAVAQNDSTDASVAGSGLVNLPGTPGTTGTTGGSKGGYIDPGLNHASLKMQTTPVKVDGVAAKETGIGVVKKCLDRLRVGTGNASWNPDFFREVKGGDGRVYLMPKNEQDANRVLEIFVDLNIRGAKMINVLKSRVKPDGTISDRMSTDVSQSEFDRVAQIFADPTASRLIIMNTTISNGFLGFSECDGKIITVSTEYIYSRGWTWENFGYVLHELAHAAGKSPAENVAHNREFFRVFRAMALAAVEAGVWLRDAQPWWTFEKDSSNLGAWGWNVSWYDQQMKWLDSNNWNGAAPAPGAAPFIAEYGTQVKARKARRTVRRSSSSSSTKKKKQKRSSSSSARKVVRKKKKKKIRRRR